MGIRSITDSSRKLSAAELDELEARLDASLPESYRAFLMKHNGGRPHPAMYLHGRRLDQFLSVHDAPETYGNLWDTLNYPQRCKPRGGSQVLESTLAYRGYYRRPLPRALM